MRGFFVPLGFIYEGAVCGVGRHDSRAVSQCRLCSLKLETRQTLIEITSSDEHFVAATINDPTPIHHDDAIGVYHCGQSVRDNDGGALAHDVSQCLLHMPFTFRVERAGGFVEK